MSKSFRYPQTLLSASTISFNVAKLYEIVGTVGNHITWFYTFSIHKWIPLLGFKIKAQTGMSVYPQLFNRRWRNPQAPTAMACGEMENKRAMFASMSSGALTAVCFSEWVNVHAIVRTHESPFCTETMHSKAGSVCVLMVCAASWTGRKPTVDPSSQGYTNKCVSNNKWALAGIVLPVLGASSMNLCEGGWEAKQP